MKLLSVFIAASFLVLSAVGCGGSDTVDDIIDEILEDFYGATSGVVTLSGDDTSEVGTTLDTGFVGTHLKTENQPDYIVIVDRESIVSSSGTDILIPENTDPANGFVMVVTDDTADSGLTSISMTIVVNEVEFSYACTSPVSTFVECGSGSISLDIANGTVDFDNVDVINVDSNSILVIDGSLSWNN